ncbi:MAG: MBL fold metallo-hydrolase [Solirubrobacterales bacterium]|nr:MBL fold metallo-hydrolase [Solirubrobacterales bacterium]
MSVKNPPAGLEEVADGVWLMRGDLKRAMNIYFLRGPDGEIVQFDAGTKSMARANRRVAAEFGGIERLVLGHAHADHRGTASRAGIPVYCHPDEVDDLRSPAHRSPYAHLSKLEVAPIRWLYPLLLTWWDGGPVEPAGTVSEGDRVAGFEVIHFPGHAPGLIGLWRESDRVALVSDTIYLVDSARMKPLPEGVAEVPHPAWAWDHAKAKESVLKLAALKPQTVLAGHGDPLRGEDLTPVLERAAEAH